jgi:hypothetical protein
MLIDIGAGLNLLFSERFAKEAGVLDPTRKTWITSGEGIGGQIELRLTLLRSLRIGPYRFKKIPITIFDDNNNVTNYPHWAGLIGNDLLRRFNIILNYPAFIMMNLTTPISGWNFISSTVESQLDL